MKMFSVGDVLIYKEWHSGNTEIIEIMDILCDITRNGGEGVLSYQIKVLGTIKGGERHGRKYKSSTQVTFAAADQSFHTFAEKGYSPEETNLLIKLFA